MQHYDGYYKQFNKYIKFVIIIFWNFGYDDLLVDNVIQ